MKQDLRSLISPEALRTLAGTDPLVELLLKLGKPLTRESYLAFAYPDGLPEEWDAELEGMLPEPFQQPDAESPPPER